MTVSERFDGGYVPEPNSGCWLWTKCLSGTGYAKFVSPVGTLAHRYSYFREHGQIPAGLDLDHLCRVRSCVNPNHLEPVTRSVNLRRGHRAARRTTRRFCKRGHEFTPENTGRGGFMGTGRVCRACDNQRRKDRRTTRHP